MTVLNLDLGSWDRCCLLKRCLVTTADTSWHLPSSSVEFRRDMDADADAGSLDSTHMHRRRSNVPCSYL
ncbi:hypothetical protein AB1N83_008087 [Pleurotus pulmonarius]